MKVPTWSILVFLFYVIVPQYGASESGLKELLREISKSNKRGVANLKKIPDLNKLSKKYLDPEACGNYAAVKRDSHGTIDFPPGTSKYSAFSDCAWAIIGGDNSRVTVKFTYVEIERDTPCDDFIRIYSMKQDSSGGYKYTPLTDEICPSQISQMTQQVFTTTQDGIYVELKSDWWDNKRGFTLSYEIQRNGGKPPSPPNNGGGGNGNAGNGGSTAGGSNDVTSLNCDFDQGNLCGWNNINGDSLDWKVQKGAESPWRQWGKTDHTTGRSSGAYAYLYTNDATRGQGGILTSPVLSSGPSAGRCMTFYYNMLQTDGTFKVIMKYSDGGSQTVLHREGSQGDGWLKATVALASKQPYSIQFEHTRGSVSAETGLAIDDTKVTQQPCASRLLKCGENIYSNRKRRDLRSLLKAVLEKEDERELEEIEDRIIGGQESRKGEFPWIAHLRIFSGGIDSGRYSQCGGSIIDDEWILTAAHCFEKDGQTYTNPNNVRIYLGEHNTHINEVEESQFVLIPEKVIIHPDRNQNRYGLDGHSYDVTLLKLKYKLTFTNNVNRVCLPERPFKPRTECLAAGWGLAESGDTSEKLLHLAKYIQNDGDCQPYTINNDMICAIAPSGVADVCQGDSGGPLVCKRSNKYELAGAVSFGDACSSRRRTSGVYADIYFFMSWIMSTIS